jgi:hypothetical protein
VNVATNTHIRAEDLGRAAALSGILAARDK